MFNPEQYTLAKGITYAETAIPGLSSPILQFVHGNTQTLDMELFLDTYEAHNNTGANNRAGADVRTFTRRVTDLMKINPGTHAPPVLLFVWGSLAFTCVLVSASQRFVMFLADGTPVRARMQVSFREFRNVDLEAREIKRETATFSKFHTVLENETISSIAGKLYNDPTVWRPIAIANSIEDPRSLEPGTTLVVPQLPFRDPESGEVHQ
jgi:hypothetical protein